MKKYNDISQHIKSKLAYTASLKVALEQEIQQQFGLTQREFICRLRATPSAAIETRELVNREFSKAMAKASKKNRRHCIPSHRVAI